MAIMHMYLTRGAENHQNQAGESTSSEIVVAACSLLRLKLSLAEIEMAFGRYRLI